MYLGFKWADKMATSQIQIDIKKLVIYVKIWEASWKFVVQVRKESY